MDTKTSEAIVKELLKRPNPKARKMYNHFSIQMPNFLHQIDLLHLPNDSGFQYALTLVDVASRYKGARPLRNKTAVATLNALLDIYEKDEYLKWPAIINADKGGEFSKIKKECEDRDTVFQENEKSNHLAFVESFNKHLAKKLFLPQSIKEIETGRVSKVWFKSLPAVVEKFNNTETSMIKMKPIKAIQMESVPQPANDFSEKDMKKHWPIGTRVRRLLNNDEVLDWASGKITVERRRATDPYWSLVVYEVSEIIQVDGKLVEHKLKMDNGREYPHYYTYWQLLKTKASI